MDLTFRLYQPEDNAVFWQLRNQVLPADESKAYWLERIENADTTIQEIAIVAQLEQQAIGFVHLQRRQSWGVGRWQIHLAVLASNRRQGVGTALWQRLQTTTQWLEVRELNCPLRNPEPAAYAFLEQHFFTIHERSIRSHLTLPQELDLGLIQRLEQQNYVFTTLLELGDTPTNREKLYYVGC